LYCIVLYFVLYCIVYCILLYCIALYCIILTLYCIMLYCIVFIVLCCIVLYYCFQYYCIVLHYFSQQYLTIVISLCLHIFCIHMSLSRYVRWQCGYTPLITAAMKGRLAFMQYLLKCGADGSIRDNVLFYLSVYIRVVCVCVSWWIVCSLCNLWVCTSSRSLSLSVSVWLFVCLSLCLCVYLPCMYVRVYICTYLCTQTHTHTHTHHSINGRCFHGRLRGYVYIIAHVHTYFFDTVLCFVLNSSVCVCDIPLLVCAGIHFNC